ncbi:MAG TPA: outer membrane beta-barrel protein [Methylomirabilota bacterium]
MGLHGHRLIVGSLGFAVAMACAPHTAFAQAMASELDVLRQEIQRLQQRLNTLEERQKQEQRPTEPPRQAPAPRPIPAPGQSVEQPASGEPREKAGVVPVRQGPTGAIVPAVAPPPGEQEIKLEREHPFETLGLSKPEIGGVRFSGFFVGSANFNSHIQMVPEFAGNAPVSSEPRSLDFRFDQFTIGAYKTFSPWLSAGASIEVERHGHRHSHGFDPAFGCPGTGMCIEQFGTEEIETEVSLHRFNITGIAPIGNGVAISFGRFDTPYGYERHDAALNLTATISELQQFGRPQSMTGFQVAYQFAPWLDAVAWIANRWENETTEDPLEDNNRDKSFGGRIGFTPLHGDQLLNIGIGGWWGPEQSNDTANPRWIIDADITWSPLRRLLLAAEFLYGGESGVSFRRRGVPFEADAVTDKDVNWWGLYALAHYDIFDWLGVSFRYGYFNDMDAARTGVKQILQSFTIAPVFHLSRLIPDLRPVGVAYTRTRHPLDWVDIRLEYRLNHSNRPVFSDQPPGVPILRADRDSHQVTLQFVVNY